MGAGGLPLPRAWGSPSEGPCPLVSSLLFPLLFSIGQLAANEDPDFTAAPTLPACQQIRDEQGQPWMGEKGLARWAGQDLAH